MRICKICKILSSRKTGTLKGVTGNLGLQPLYAAVCAIVEPLRSKEKADYRTLYANIAAEFSRAERLRDALRGGI